MDKNLEELKKLILGGHQSYQENLEKVKELVDNLFKLSDTVKVIFLKRNGEVRTMICTKKLELVPSEKRPVDDPDKPKRAANPDLCMVYEIDNDWRSFRYDSILDIETM